ncbi:hypothetical protein [Aliirhizobium smilacinae]|uniref:Uncharacterized protein n=1 Tax=Aliirhizobium smilacinae TaxID=1395944 RepID=A0A5C4XAC1_9HYPH|nr:hypothetical protein [Rhizobium smilacinae]TNM60357.1 hypothetical protein FHP24_26580 [Rhizobium smilacinae]
MVFSSFDVLGSDDLTMLRGVLDDLCCEQKLDTKDPQTQAVARDLINWWLFGVRTPANLRQILEPITI